MTTDQELQEELVFRRFPAEKQEQVRGLVSYAMLMGLDGRDLTSIGQKLTRFAQTEKRRSNLERIADYKCLAIKKSGRPLGIDDNFRLETVHGIYKFGHKFGNTWNIINPDQSTIRTYGVVNCEEEFAGTTNNYCNQQKIRRMQLLLDIADGHLVLTF